MDESRNTHQVKKSRSIRPPKWRGWRRRKEKKREEIVYRILGLHIDLEVSTLESLDKDLHIFLLEISRSPLALLSRKGYEHGDGFEGEGRVAAAMGKRAVFIDRADDKKEFQSTPQNY